MTKSEFIEKVLKDYDLTDVDSSSNENGKLHAIMLEAMNFKEDFSGWTNYATWRVNLEFVDGMDWQDDDSVYDTMYDLAESIKDQVENYINDNTPNKDNSSLITGWVTAFISEVNWYEIAESVTKSYPEIINNEIVK